VGAMVEDGKFRVEKFNGKNFSLWKIHMEDYLYQKDLYLPLDGKAKMPKGMKYEEWNLLDRKASEQYNCASQHWSPSTFQRKQKQRV